jgi:hypothetical protein
LEPVTWDLSYKNTIRKPTACNALRELQLTVSLTHSMVFPGSASLVTRWPGSPPLQYETRFEAFLHFLLLGNSLHLSGIANVSHQEIMEKTQKSCYLSSGLYRLSPFECVQLDAEFSLFQSSIMSSNLNSILISDEAFSRLEGKSQLHY